MDEISVKTDEVKEVAITIDALNTLLCNEFKKVTAAIQKLNEKWNGEASTDILSHYYESVPKYKDSVSNDLKEFSTYLKRHAVTGYVKTENKNQGLADQFK